MTPEQPTPTPADTPAPTASAPDPVVTPPAATAVPAPQAPELKFKFLDFSSPKTEDAAWLKLRIGAYAGLVYGILTILASIYLYTRSGDVIDLVMIAYYAIPIVGALYILKKRAGGMVAIALPFILSFALALLSNPATITSLIYLAFFGLIFQGMMGWRALRDWRRAAQTINQ